MTGFAQLLDQLPLRFLLASAGCLAAGLGVWGATALLRRLPGVALQRSTWLLGQATVLACFLVILLPHSERLRLVPPIDVADMAPSRAAAPQGPTARPAVGGAPAAAVPGADPASWLTLVAQAWLLAYLLGFGHAVLRLLLARRMLDSLAATGSRLPCPGQPARAPVVIEVDAPISPMLFGLLKPRLLLPQHLRGFDAAQQQLIVEHELMHWRRRDLQWLSVGIVLQTLLWFNPFMRMLRSSLSWAQELGCDRDVLRSRSPAQRKAYAAALVAQLRLQHATPKTALAFGGVCASTLAARIALIREPSPAHPRRARVVRILAIAALACVFAASLAFQPALARRSAPTATQAPFSCTVMVDAASGEQLAREGHCDERVTPASTFNIPVALMGFDSGILKDARAPVLPFKTGYPSYNASWRADTDPSSWLQNSVLWYAQQVTTGLGAARFHEYVQRFDYGNRDVGGDPGKDNGTTQSWVGSSLRISPLEQVSFLRKVANRDLPLSAHAYDMTTRIMPKRTLANGWEVVGKTGTAPGLGRDGNDDATRQYGWYVGWAKKGQRTVVFARLVLDAKQESAMGGARAREAMLRQLTARLDVL
ncbi:class D beta-lactamase [Massilia eurypsychrophila]|jgi:bla regulator protein BlaR1|uniref:Class D beta-lactamase n=1 Tax=Massilia eurypsychrophila TaxID=1485217 RepID=A0A2G8TE26_9BURK|nr:class D beta-lactamase [Massilia eurypsychrophila]PIL44244.1 class D beta-lactamase [Massilia eurypsychrophila]